MVASVIILIIGGTIALISKTTWTKIEESKESMAFERKVKLCLMLSNEDTYFGKSWCEAPNYEAAVAKGNDFCSNRDTYTWYRCDGE